MRILVVWAHPLAESYSAALKNRAVSTLEEAGHQIDLLDLYSENFDPVLSAQERRGLSRNRTQPRHCPSVCGEPTSR